MSEGKSSTAALNPDELELVPGTRHENLEGWIPELASEQEVKESLEKAFDYRGDVTLTLKSGERFEAYIFDRKTGSTLADSYVRAQGPTADVLALYRASVEEQATLPA